ncbi:MAG: GNAT family N-acetyltransferase [Pseudomonadota bacterium]
MEEIRPARPDDAEALATLHVAAWAETYPGLLPDDEIAAHGLELRRAQWHRQFERGGTRIVIAPGQGFAQVGPQRDEPLNRGGYGEELYSIYVLRAAQGTGLGRSLLRAVLGPEPEAFTALVLEGNARATGFYEHAGGQWIELRAEMVGGSPIRERVYGWSQDAALSLGGEGA